MRELKRSIARHMMEIHGIEQINKPKYTRPGKPGTPNNNKKASFFALNWKDYLNPESRQRESLHKMLRTREARYPRGNGKTTCSPWPLA